MTITLDQTVFAYHAIGLALACLFALAVGMWLLWFLWIVRR